MKQFLFVLVVVAALIASGCVTLNPDYGTTPVQTTKQTTKLPAQTKVVKTTMTKIQTTVPTPVPTVERAITDGFWCRDTTMNIGKAPTNVRECYQFFSDGTYKWGYSPGRAMGKSPSCSGAPGAKCAYSLNPDGKYEVEGGYMYTLSGDTLVDPHDPPYFTWTSAGIP